MDHPNQFQQEQPQEQPIILIVDDNTTNLNILFEYLKASQFKILVAEDGEAAFTVAKKAQPDIIMLDIIMPGLDGFDTCIKLKSDDQTKAIPVIFMTALSDTESKIKGFKVGAVDYITKPFQHEEVLARLNTHLTIQLQKKQLEEALARVKTLRGLIPICAVCKNIRNDKGYWERMESYIKSHSDADFSHGICPDCATKMYPHIFPKEKMKDGDFPNF